MGQSPLGKMFAQTKVSGGALVPVVADAQGRLQVSGNGVVPDGSFMGANSAGVTTSIALATTYLGLCLSNPAGSGVNLYLHRVAGVFNVALSALTAIGLIGGFAAGGVTGHTTPAVVRSPIIGGSAAAAKAKLDAACTLVGTPAWYDWIQETPPATNGAQFARDYDGQIMIPPGGYVAIGTLVASPASAFFGSMYWQEVAIA